MPFQDRISHAAAVAKWKADQQMRLLKAQNQVRELENQIRLQKAVLADTTFTLHTQERLTEDELKQICATIVQLQEQIREKQREQDMIKQEQSPQSQDHPSSPQPSPTLFPSSTNTTSSLVCPQCGRLLTGRFCPEHGVEGVQKAFVQDSTQSSMPATTGQLICPKCRKPLSVRFCPEHGEAGIPA